MYIYFMHYLNFFLSCSIKSLTLASVSRLFTIKISLFRSFNFHSGHGLQSIKAITESQLYDFLINSRHFHEKYFFHYCTL